MFFLYPYTVLFSLRKEIRLRWRLFAIKVEFLWKRVLIEFKYKIRHPLADRWRFIQRLFFGIVKYYRRIWKEIRENGGSLSPGRADEIAKEVLDEIKRMEVLEEGGITEEVGRAIREANALFADMISPVVVSWRLQKFYVKRGVELDVGIMHDLIAADGWLAVDEYINGEVMRQKTSPEK